ncbi:DUF808 domain-containing protein [Nocardioides sp. Kera G14]|uniref:DUF808 domain-containing protein n=1 Tax=Nocardioides sp. Kera G14 TaxID=2884264 RepID=UPI001D0F7721|nr:DUF808 domain-containing protein [Nocardioides sp. Kera G14]UDY22739.1 DUF808 domain-containing protein [Nocardioides sp. Kera G14]
MSAGLFGLLDDVAAIAKLAAASLDDVGAAAGRATTKTVGVVIDDTAVAPQYVDGLAPERELPIVAKIAKGSLRNKLLIILPVALLLSQFASGVIPVILICGGLYLCFEGVEKVLEALGIGGHGHRDEAPVLAEGEAREKEMIAGAVRTDLILSTEIMVIALNEVADESIWTRLLILVVVAILITIGVYGVVAAIVKMDDVGLHLAQRSGRGAQALGRGLVRAMPALLASLSVIGTAAMIWVGGHLVLTSSHELGLHQPYGWVHEAEHSVHEHLHAVGAIAGWLFNTVVSALIGFVLGAIVVGVMHLVPRKGH